MRARKSAITSHPILEYQSIDQFEATGGLPSGRFVIWHGGLPVDLLYEPVDAAKTTIVVFHGSTSKDVSLPMHAGAGITRGLSANRLAISDPSLTSDDSHNLILSWFAGSSAQPDLQHFLETVIRRIKEVSGVSNLIFMGGSGGGFASLEMSRRFAGSLALAMNPQTILAEYYPPPCHEIPRFMLGRFTIVIRASRSCDPQYCGSVPQCSK